MAFERAVILNQSGPAGTGVRAVMRRTPKSPARLAINVSAHVAAEFGWKDGDPIEVMIGTGSDRGMVRLRKSKAGQVKLQRRGANKAVYFRLDLGHQPMFVNRTQSSEWCQKEVLDDGWVEVVLPKWADDDPAAKPVEKSVARPPKNVTAAVMGDPTPERRDLMRKMSAATG